MMLAFFRARADLLPLHHVADGSFPCGDPNPVKKAVIREGLDTLVRGKFLLGNFFDGDGDRIDFYFGDGRYLSSSFVYSGMLPAVRERFGGSGVGGPGVGGPGDSGPGLGVYADIKTNPLAVLEMAKTGMKVSMIRNGHSQIKNAMFEDASICGAVEESAHYYEAFHLDGRRFCTENTLYVALLVSRLWHEAPERFEALWQLQARTGREREWGHKFKTDAERAAALAGVEAHFTRDGAQSRSRALDGSDLEATILRSGVSFDLDAGSRLSSSWFQVCQRISQSEDGLARWEVVASSAEIAAEAKRAIVNIVKQFGAGDEYQG
jgi:phosphomannomutase